MIDEDTITLIHLAVDNGVTFLDTSDIYGPFTNEILLGKVVLLYSTTHKWVTLSLVFLVFIFN